MTTVMNKLAPDLDALNSNSVNWSFHPSYFSQLATALPTNCCISLPLSPTSLILHSHPQAHHDGIIQDTQQVETVAPNHVFSEVSNAPSRRSSTAIQSPVEFSNSDSDFSIDGDEYESKEFKSLARLHTSEQMKLSLNEALSPTLSNSSSSSLSHRRSKFSRSGSESNAR
jgi:hypothetical protein